MKVKILLATDETLKDTGWNLYGNGDIIRTYDSRIATAATIKNENSNSSIIYIAPSAKSRGGGFSINYVIGHEIIHAYHYLIGLKDIAFSESASYTYELAFSKAYGNLVNAAAARSKLKFDFGYSYPSAYSWTRLPSFINLGIK